VFGHPGADFFLGHTGRIANVAWETPTRGIAYGSPGSFLRHYDGNVTVTFASSPPVGTAVAVPIPP